MFLKHCFNTLSTKFFYHYDLQMYTWFHRVMFLLFSGLYANCLECQLNTTLNFYIDSNTVIEGETIEKFDTKLLSECVQRCAYNLACSGANFLLNVNEDPICLLVDTTKKGLAAKTPTKESVMYSIHGYCQDKDEKALCRERAWSYEKFANLGIKSSSFIFAESKSSGLPSCLASCSARQNCEAVLFDAGASKCMYLSISLHTVHHIEKFFAVSSTTDLFERNCMKGHMNMGKCTFLRINHAGFTDVFDMRLDTVADSSTCESICISWHYGTCRSFTYDRKEQRCYISHIASRLIGRKPMQHLNADLSFGELDDCMQFSLNCKSGSLELTGKAMKIFDGALKARKGTQIMCQHNVSHSFEFSTMMKYGECGVHAQPYPISSFVGTILVKEGSTDMITVKDKIVQVSCRMHNESEPIENQFLSYQFEVTDNSTSNVLTHDVSSIATPLLSRTNGKARKQKYRLEVLSDDGAVANVVSVGGKGQLLITVDEDSKLNENDFVISELSAEDSNTKKRLSLIDSNGCVSKNDIITKLSKPTKRQLRIDIMFKGFDDQAQVIYHAIAKPCKTNCILACNKPYYSHGYFKKSASTEKRVRRSIDSQEPRTFDLEEDVYPVRTRREIVLVDPLSKEYFKEARNIIINDDYSLSNTIKLYKKFQRAERMPELENCLTENLGCAFAIGLGVAQVAVLFVLAVVLCYNIKLLFKHNHVQHLEESLIIHENQNVNRGIGEHNVETDLLGASK